jgi:hypothetical protein
MLKGRFGNTSGAPFIEARVSFPRLKISVQVPPAGEADISFLIDTGADRTTIMPPDWLRFSVPYARLGNPAKLNGIGGVADGFRETALITFSEANVGLRSYEVEVLIYKPTSNMPPCPSLLGRDVIQNWAITFDKRNNSIKANVLRADHTFKFNKQIPNLVPLVGVPPPVLHS